MSLTLILIAALSLAFANGANDNFKGVATLFGSATTNYRRALLWATFTTLLGSLTAVAFASELISRFSGKGLVSESLTDDPHYGAAVALGAGLTVLLATRLGMPISTTHALVGALVGAGVAASSSIDFASLGGGYFLPLLVSPVLALAATVMLYPIIHWFRRADPRPHAGSTSWLDRGHYLSAGVVSYARGLNDTPKIAALLLFAPQLGTFAATGLVGVVIAIGGLTSARRVAETMSRKITPMTHGQGFTANLITGAIVIGASRLGMPVSTTHVSCGALFGIGTHGRRGDLRMIGIIVLAWVTTLPVGALLGAACFVVT